jgi:hypothetical protein
VFSSSYVHSDGDQEAEAVLSCLLAAAQAHDVQVCDAAAALPFVPENRHKLDGMLLHHACWPQALLGAGVLELLRVLAPLGYSSSPSVATGMLPALSRCILSSGNDALHPREAIMAICELLVSHSRCTAPQNAACVMRCSDGLQACVDH